MELNGLWYKFYNPSNPNDRLSFDGAKAKCKSENGHLAYIKDDATQQMITTQLAGLNLVEDGWVKWERGYWVGGVCGGGNNNWKWEDGTSIGSSTYENWYVGGNCGADEPNYNAPASRVMLYFFDVYGICSSALGKWGDTVDGNDAKNWICMGDVCNPNPCENEGTCNATTDGYHCLCQAGFIGKNCATNLCDPNPCENSGTCNHAPGGYQCNCSEGFHGDYCQTDLCESNPCENGGTCIHEPDGYQCNCADGFNGDHCQTDLCESNPCENGGTCNYAPGGYQCNCADGFIGDNCQADLCESNPCENGGTCNHVPGGYQCNCADGLVGDFCQTDLCDPSPCENSGTCVRKVGGNFSCDCEPAYTGTLCENANYESSENVDYLLHINYNSFSTFSRSSEDCRSNGQSDLVIIKDAETQQNIENKVNELYGQEAKEFWIGAEKKYAGWFWLDGSQLTFTNWGETGNDGAGNCLKMVSQSGSSQLQWIVGHCEEQLLYICEKPANNIDSCTVTECLNSGTCFSSGSHFNCQCVVGFEGVNCEIKISDPTIAILASISGLLALVIIILVVSLVYMRRKKISPKHVQSIKSKQPSGELRNPTEGDYLEINGTGQATSSQHTVMAQQSYYVNDGISGLEYETCSTTQFPPTSPTSTIDNHQYEEIFHKRI